MSLSRLNRRMHSWIAILTAIPLLVVLVSGLLLQVKGKVTWVQPATVAGGGDVPMVSFDQILAASKTVPEAEIADWSDIDRLDVRPSKGVVKVRSENRWEIQLDTQTAQVLQVAYRRSDLIESLHDGSFFHDIVKWWVFLPSALLVLALWITGMYLWIKPRLPRPKRSSVARTTLATP